jgi:hypothetical protein
MKLKIKLAITTVVTLTIYLLFQLCSLLVFYFGDISHTSNPVSISIESSKSSKRFLREIKQHIFEDSSLKGDKLIKQAWVESVTMDSYIFPTKTKRERIIGYALVVSIDSLIEDSTLICNSIEFSSEGNGLFEFFNKENIFPDTLVCHIQR